MTMPKTPPPTLLMPVPGRHSGWRGAVLAACGLVQGAIVKLACACARCGVSAFEIVAVVAP